MDLLIWTAAALILFALLYAVIAGIGAWCWREATRVLVARLQAADVSAGATRYHARDIVDLPAPVRRYFDCALTDGQLILRSVDLALNGMFNMSLNAPQWKPFTSTQHVVANRPGFVWNARIRLFPGVSVRVHDAYVAGEGLLRPSVLGLFSLGEVRGQGEIARGELMRWLAESVWYPTALLPGNGVEWQALDAQSAQAILTDGLIKLTMLFRFGNDGLVSGVRVEARSVLVAGKMVMMPWEGHFRDYRRLDGMMIPFHGEVAWITPQGAKPYFWGSVSQIAHRFVK